MRDLTTGSIGGHLAHMAGPIAAGMLFSAAYFLVDLYFVAHVGAAAIAGVGAAGNVVFLVLALTQMLAAGTLALLSHAVGRKDQAEANLIFNQASALGALLSITIDNGGPYWDRVKRIGASAIFGGAPGLLIGMLIHGRGWVAVGAVVFVAGVSSILSRLGTSGPALSTAILDRYPPAS